MSYLYIVFFLVFIVIYFLHKVKVEDYGYLKPYREITLRELVAIRYIEHRIRFSMESMFLWLYRVKKKKVYRFDNITNAFLQEVRHPNIKKYSYYAFKFKHNDLEHQLRISLPMYDYLKKMKIYSATAVEFTKELSGEWYLLSIELEEKKYLWEEDSPVVKQKIDYIELYKLMNLRKNKIDASLIALKVHRATKKERKEFEFYKLGSITIWLALFMVFMSLLGGLSSIVLGYFFLFPLNGIALWYAFYFYKKRVWYWKNSKVYTVQGELSFDYSLYAYTLNEKELHLSKEWKNFLDKHTKRSQSYFVEMDVLINRYETVSFLPIYQPIRLKVLNTQIDYEKLPTRKHPLFLMVLLIALYFILFNFNYQESLEKSFYGLKNIYEKGKSELFPYKEVEFKSFPIPILDKGYHVMAYTLLENNQTINKVYRAFTKKENSFEFHNYYVELENNYDYIFSNLHDLRILLSYPLKKSELNSKFLKLLNDKYELLQKLQKLQYKASVGKETDKYTQTYQSLLELDRNLLTLYKQIQENNFLIIQKEFEFVLNSLKELYSLSEIYIKNENAIYDNKSCHNIQECNDDLRELYEIYNRVITPPKLETIKGVVKPYFYANHIKLIERGRDYNKDMNNRILAMIIWVLLLLFFIVLLINTLYQTILYIWGLFHYGFTYNRTDIALKKSLDEIGTPSFCTPREKQFQLTIEKVVIMVLSFLLVIFLLSFKENRGGGSTDYAKRAYEERLRKKERLEKLKKEEMQLVMLLKRISQNKDYINETKRSEK